jgi:hypothetical protein
MEFMLALCLLLLAALAELPACETAAVAAAVAGAGAGAGASTIETDLVGLGGAGGRPVDAGAGTLTPGAALLAVLVVEAVVPLLVLSSCVVNMGTAALTFTVPDCLLALVLLTLSV